MVGQCQAWAKPKKSTDNSVLKKEIRFEPVDLPFRVVALAYLKKEQNLY